MCNTLVGIRTGPFTLSLLSLAPLIKSAHTFSRFFTFLEERVIRIRWTFSTGSSTPIFPGLIGIAMMQAGKDHPRQTRCLRGKPQPYDAKNTFERAKKSHCVGFDGFHFRSGIFRRTCQQTRFEARNTEAIGTVVQSVFGMLFTSLCHGGKISNKLLFFIKRNVKCTQVFY